MLSLYIHFPWCIKKCPYCDFNSYPEKDIPEDIYVAALFEDLKTDLLKINDRRNLKSIFFGGGTPSLFTPKAIEKILFFIGENFNFSKDIEITLEANVGTMDKQKCLALRSLGINRLSLGVQSFQDEKLKALGRIHRQKEAFNAIEYAIFADFSNFNIDLMYGLPNQSIDDALYDLQCALSFKPPHISWYQLTLEPNTEFYLNPPSLPSEDMVFAIRTKGQDFLAANGYKQYEVSGYSISEEKQCQHNLNYWEFGDYLGIGAGAHGKVTDFLHKKIIRISKKNNPIDYLQGIKTATFIDEERELLKTDLQLEFMMNVLRLYRKIPLALFKERTFLDAITIMPILREAKELGLIDFDNEYFATTEKGKNFLNDLLELFVKL